MANRFNNKDTLSRFRKYKENLRINDNSVIIDSITHCIHLAKQGTSCALIIDTMEDNAMVYSILQHAVLCSDLELASNGEGGTLLKNGAEIRIITVNSAFTVRLLMGEDTIILHVKDGDPRAKKAREVLDL